MNIYLDVQSPAVKEAGTLASAYGLANHGLVNLRRAYWNLPTPALYEESIFRSESSLSHLGPLVVNTGKHTARAAADKRNFVPRADADHRLYLRRTARQHNGAWHHAKVCQPVTLVGLQLALAGDQAVRANGGAQLVYLALGKHSAHQLT